MAEKVDDLTLPNSIIARLVKEAVPEGVNLSKDARVAFSRAASVFVLFATSSANNFALKAKRKTLTGADVIQALEDMQLESFIDSVKKCYEAFRQEKGKKESLGGSGKGRKRKEPESVNEVPEETPPPPHPPAENGHASGGETSD